MQFTYTTDRLVLQVLGHECSSIVLDFYKKNKLFFEPWEPNHVENFYTIEYQMANLEAELKMFMNSRSIRYYLFKNNEKETIIGTISFSNITGYPSYSCQIGYRLDQNNQGNGYAIEALTFLIPIVMNDLRISRIEANVMQTNKMSIKLLKHLCFTYEGIARGCYEVQGKRTDHLRYSLLDSDVFSKV